MNHQGTLRVSLWIDDQCVHTVRELTDLEVIVTNDVRKHLKAIGVVQVSNGHLAIFKKYVFVEPHYTFKLSVDYRDSLLRDAETTAVFFVNQRPDYPILIEPEG